MLNGIRKIGLTVAALAALALGGSALAGAASNSTSSSSNTATSNAAPPAGAPAGDPGRPPAGAPHHTPEVALTGTTAEKVRAAAQKKVPGATIERVENDSDSSSPYEAHMRTSDGSEIVVLVNDQFEVTAVNPFGPPR
jgi:hypothetical protein